MAVTFSKSGNKVVIDEGGIGTELPTNSRVSWNNSHDYIYINPPFDGNITKGFKYLISNIVGRPNDNPSDVADYLRSNFFFDIITSYSGIYNNYSDLVSNETAGIAGRIFKVLNSQGTRWSTIGIGGTYYPSGTYLDTGSSFTSDREAIVNQLQELLDTTTQVSDIKTVTSDYSVSPTDKVILVDTSSGNINVTLPSIGVLDVVDVAIKKIDTSTNSITINTPNSETIDGLLSRDISTYLQSRNINSDGTNYFQTGGYTPNIENRIIVKRAEQLAGTLDSNKVYFIDGLIDMGSIEITAPSGGLFLTGIDYFKSGLYSDDDNYTMFKTASGIPTSNVRIQELNFWTSGANSKIFNLDGTGNFGAVEFNSCNLGDFGGTTTEIGELTGFRQFRTNDSGFFLVQDGLTFSGTWGGGFRIGDSIALASGSNVTLFKEGTSLLFQGRSISDINASSLNNTTTVFGFQESNFSEDGSFQLEGAAFNRDAPAVPNISSSSTKAFFKDCIGIDNTKVRALVTSTTQVTNTLTVGVEEKVEGDTVLTYGTWMSSPVSNRITIDTEVEMDLEVSYQCRVDGGANDELAVSINHYNSSGTLINQVARKVKTISNVLGGLDISDFNVNGVILNTNPGDYIEPGLENTTDGTEATVLIGAELKAVRI